MNTIASPAAGILPFSANVGVLPLPVALERAFQARATGLLVLEARQGRHVVYIRDGYPVSVELPGSFELLGKVLVEMKMLDEVAYQESLASPPPEGQRYGDRLLARGLITEEQLRTALKAQVRRKLHRLFFLAEASIEFILQEHEEGLQRQESLRVHPWRACYHGVRSAWNADRLRLSLTPLGGRAIRTPLTTEELARFGLGADDGRAAQLLRDHAQTVDALAAASALPIQPVSALCYAIYVAGGLVDETASAPTRFPTDGPTRKSGSTIPAATAPLQPPVRPTGPQPPVAPIRAPAAPPPVAPVRAPTGAHPPVAAIPPARSVSGGHPPVAAPRAPTGPQQPVTRSAPQSAAAADLQESVDRRRDTIESDDLFAVLGLTRAATPEQLKIAYLEGARRYHPDRLAALGLQHLRDDVEKIFRRLSEAQSVLLDDTRRAQYIASLDRPRATAADAAAHQQVVSAIEAEVAFRRGQTSLRRNDLGAALKDFQAALTFQPAEGDHVIYTAWTLHCLKQLTVEATRTELQRGLKLNPHAAAGHYFLGMLRKEEGAFDAALVDFKRAVALDDRQFEAEQEIRFINTRRAKGGEKKGLLDRFRKG